LFAEFKARGVPIQLEPHDQSWGNREMYVRDADSNSLRFIQSRQ
jgi:catechol 2,3-dioxygenase-like lactoylglutathione lyase family enzyme